MAVAKKAVVKASTPAPVPAKKVKAAAAPAKEKTPRTVGSKAFPADTKIVVLAAKNPKRPTSASYLRFELYGRNKTVASFVAAGGTYADLKYDTEHAFIKVG